MQLRARRRRRLRALLLERDRACGSALGGLAALAVHPADDNLSAVGAGRESHAARRLHLRVAAASHSGGDRRVGDRGRRREANASRTRAATSCARRLRSSAGRTPSSSRPIARGPTAIRRSFPSGHASTSFATAMVLQEHFGWKVGLPAFAVGGLHRRVARRRQSALGERRGLRRRPRAGIRTHGHAPPA